MSVMNREAVSVTNREATSEAITYARIVELLTAELKAVVAKFVSLPVIWPGQVPSRVFPPNQTYALVSTVLTDETPISLGVDPVYQSVGQVVLRFLAAIAPPGELIKIRNVASNVKDAWRKSVEVDQVYVSSFQIIEGPIAQGRMPIDVVLNFYYYS